MPESPNGSQNQTSGEVEQGPLPLDPDATCAMNESPRVALILDQYLNDLQNGRACSRKSLLAKHSEFADELSEYLDGLEMVSGLGVGSELVPGRMGDFEVIRAIGRGAMGVVYEARQISLGRTVALKILRYANGGEESIKRFEREAELIASLNHSNIVPIYYVGQHEKQRFFAMQLIKGASLSQWSAQEYPLRDPQTIARWGAQIADALEHAHQNGVVHRDVKPSNILLQEEKVWLTDFGLARRFDDVRMSMTGAMLGTPNYMSPEQAAPRRHPIDHRTDIYSLGASLFELLTGRCVFLAETPHGALAQVLTDEAPELSELLPDVSPDLETILIKCLHKEPRDRYQTAKELGDDLSAYAEGRSIKARRPSMLERFSRWKTQNEESVRWATTAAVSALTFLVIGAIALISWNNSKMAGLKLNCEDGPVIGRLLSENGDATTAFTIPTQVPMSMKPGNYELQLWGNGRIGDSRQLLLAPGDSMTATVELRESGVFPDRAVRGVPRKIEVRDGDRIRHDLAIVGRDGIDRIDGQTGELVWSTPSEELVGEKFNWDWSGESQLVNKDPRIPAITEVFADLTGDDIDEILVTMRRQNLQVLLDGSTGKPVWQYVPEVSANVNPNGAEAGSLHTPWNIGDLDGDGADDFVTLFYRGTTGQSLARWLDAVSTKTGERIWRKELPKELFDTSKVAFTPPACQFNFRAPRFVHLSLHPATLKHQFRDHNSFYRTLALDAVAPWPLELVAAEDATESTEAVIVCGAHLLSLRVKDGKAGSFNGGQPIDLGFFPAVPPKLIRAKDGSTKVLLANQIAIGDQNTSTNGLTRFSLWSLETGDQIWEYDAACDTTWGASTLDWPLVTDVTGDGVPEIVVADRGDLGRRIYLNASCQGSLQALDLKTGAPIWNPKDVPMICSLDRQVQHLLPGPDADGDQKNDIYVLSPALEFSGNYHVYIEVLAGTTGRKIRTVKCSFPFVQGSQRTTRLERAFFWGEAPDGSPQMVIACNNDHGPDNSRPSMAVVSTGTGKIIKSGYQLESPLLADGNGDGRLDLFVFRPAGQLVVDGGKIVSLKAATVEAQQQVGVRLEPYSDVDADGVRDFIGDVEGRTKTKRLVSGLTGTTKWEYEFSQNNHKLQSLDHDFDGDGVNEVFGMETLHQGVQARSGLHLISGKTGTMLWNEEGPGFQTSDASFSVRCVDIEQDGNMELLVIQRKSQGGPMPTNTSSIYLDCCSGRDGKIRWSVDLAPQGIPPELFMINVDQWAIKPIETDNGLLILAPSFGTTLHQGYTAIRAKDGAKLWTHQASLIDQSNRGELCRVGLVSASDANASTKNPLIARVDFGTAKSLVSVTWLDSSTGIEVSKWSGKGHYLGLDQADLETKPPALGCPFPIQDNENNYTGVCIYGPKDDGSMGYKIMVFDPSQKEAEVINNLEFSFPVSNYGPASSRHLFFLLNSKSTSEENALGKQGLNTMLLTCNHNKLRIRELLTGAIVREREWARGQERGPLQLEPIHLSQQERQISIVATVDKESRVEVLDLDSLETLWQLDVPDLKQSSYVTRYLRPLSSSTPIPSFLISGESQVVIHAKSNDYLGKDSKIQKMLSSRESNSFAGLQGPDPRLEAQIPWSLEGYSFWNDGGMAWELLGRVAVAMGIFIFPVLYIRHWFRRRQISLRTFLALPLLFAIPYLALNLPIKTDSFTINDVWHSKVAVAIYILPAMTFTYFALRSFFTGNWRSLIGLTLGTILASIALGAILLLGQNFRVPEGAHYDFFDPGGLGILIPGINIVGSMLMGWWGVWIAVFLIRKVFARPARKKLGPA